MKRLSVVAILVLAMSLLMAACGTATTTPEVVTQVVEVTKAPQVVVVTPEPTATTAPTAEPTAEPTAVPIDRTDQSKASALVKFTLKGEGGADLGQVTDLLINVQAPHLDYAVVSNKDGQSVLVPWNALSLKTDGADPMAFYFFVEDAVFTHAPALDLTTVDFTAADWDAALKSYWNTYLATPIGEVPAPAEGETAATPMPAAQTTLVLVKVSGLLNAPVLGSAGEAVGTVNDLVIDQTNGNVLYAVVDTGGQFVLAPLSKLTLTLNADVMGVQADAALMKAAPTVDASFWSTVSTTDWDKAVQEYWAK